jgi:predicted permease
MGWVPVPLLLGVLFDEQTLGNRGFSMFDIVGRLAEGRTQADAGARLDALAGVLAQQYPREWVDRNGESRRLTVLSHRESLAPPGEREELVLAVSATATLVLLIVLLACANVAGLLLARAIARRHEIAVRLTLGATRLRLSAQLLAESLVLGLAGGTLGMVAVHWLSSFARRFAILDSFDLRPDWRVMLVAVSLSVLCALAFGLTPLIQSLRIDLRSGLSSQATTVQSSRLRGTLIAGQVAVSFVLIVLAAVAARGVRAHLDTDPGIALDDLLLGRLDMGVFARDSVREAAYIRQVDELITATPGVRSAATTTLLPRGNTHSGMTALMPDGDSLSVESNAVSARYFETVGLRPLEGRVPDARDASTAELIAVVNREFARAWGVPVVGRTIEFAGGRSARVVGVVGEVNYHLQDSAVRPLVYLVDERHRRYRGMVVQMLVRAQPGAAADVARVLQRTIRDAFPDVVTPVVEPLRQWIGRQAQPQQIAARLALGIGAVELALATVGLYGLLMYALLGRTREMGVRLALGANPGRASWAVLQSGLRYTAVGAVCGLLLGVPAALLSRRSMLVAGAVDAVPFMAAFACVLVAVALASIVPARRAARIHPVAALRHD